MKVELPAAHAQHPGMGRQAVKDLSSDHTPGRNAGSGLLLVVLATLFWSTSGLFINLAVRGSGIQAIGLAFWRDLATFLCLLVGITLIRPGLLRVERRDLPWLAAMGAVSIGLFHVLWISAVLINGVSVATVIQCNAPVFVTIMAWLLWREPLTWRKWIAIGLAFSGTILIARLDGTGGTQITLLGLLVALGSAITYGGITLFGKKLSGSYSPWTILVYIFGFATLALLPFQIGGAPPWPLTSEVLAAFAGLVLLATIAGFALYTAGLRRLQASVAAIVATAEVPFAALVGYLFLGERLDGWQVLGAGLVVGGVVLLSGKAGGVKVFGARALGRLRQSRS
jgi:drug/metabolite transporter (DMT)-like permease